MEHSKRLLAVSASRIHIQHLINNHGYMQSTGDPDICVYEYSDSKIIVAANPICEESMAELTRPMYVITAKGWRSIWALVEYEKATRSSYTSSVLKVGDKVRLLSDSYDIPAGTEGYVVEDYGTGISVAWDTVERPYPEHLSAKEVGQLLDSHPLCPIKDGFGKKGELKHLEKIHVIEIPDHPKKLLPPIS